MKCIKCDSDTNVDPRYELCEQCLRVDVFKALGEIFEPQPVPDIVKLLL